MRNARKWSRGTLLGSMVLSVWLASASREPSGAFWSDALASSDKTAVEAAMLEPSPGCGDVRRNAYTLVPRFFYDDQPENLVEALGVWERECGDTEVVQRTRILAAIWMGDPVEAVYGDAIAGYLLEFYEWHEGISLPWPSEGRPSGADFPLDPDSDPERADYDDFTISLARQLLPYTQPGTLERFFARFYSGDVAAFESVRDSTLADTVLARSYQAEIDRLSGGWEHLWAAHLGYWTPRRGLAELGDHPVLGFDLGLRHGRLLLRASMEMRILEAARSYQVVHEGRIVESDAFNALYLGFEPAVRLWRWRRLEVDASVGLGWSGLAAVEGDPDLGEPATWIHATDASVGLGLRLGMGATRSRLLGLEVRYSRLDFSTGVPGGDLVGGAWSLRLTFGFLGNRERDARLRALRGSLDGWGE